MTGTWSLLLTCVVTILSLSIVAAATTATSSGGPVLDVEAVDKMFSDTLKEAQEAKLIDSHQQEVLSSMLKTKLEAFHVPATASIGASSWEIVQTHFTLLNLLYLSGAAVVMVAMTVFMTLGIQRWGGVGILFTAVCYAGAFAWVGWQLWNKPSYSLIGGLFFSMSTCMAPLQVLGIEKLIRSHPSNTPKGLGTALLGGFTMYFIKFPFLVVLVLLGLQLAAVTFMGGTTDNRKFRVSMWFGLVVLVVTHWMEAFRQLEADFVFWMTLVGMSSFWIGMTSQSSNNRVSKFAYLIINVAIVCLGTLVYHFTVYQFFGFIGTIAGFFIQTIVSVNSTSVYLIYAYHAISLVLLFLARQASSDLFTLTAFIGLVLTYVNFGRVSQHCYVSYHSHKTIEIQNYIRFGLNIVALVILSSGWSKSTLELLFNINIFQLGRAIIVTGCAVSMNFVWRSLPERVIISRLFTSLAILFIVPKFTYLLPSIFISALPEVLTIVSINLAVAAAHFGLSPEVKGSVLLSFFMVVSVGFVELGISSMLQSPIAGFAGLALIIGTDGCTFHNRGLGVQIVYCIMNIILVFLSFVWGTQMGVVVATVALFAFIGHLARVVFKDSLMFPFFLSLIGLLLIYTGVQYQKYHETWEAALLTILPDSAPVSFTYGALAIVCIMLFLFFIFGAERMSDVNVRLDRSPLLALSKARTVYNPYLQLQIEAPLSINFPVNQCYGYVESDRFWKILEKKYGRVIMKAAKFAGYPVPLCPLLLDPAELVSGSDGMLRATIKTTSIVKTALNALAQEGDPEFTIVITYSARTFHRKVLFTLTTRASHLLKANVLPLNGTWR